MMVRRSVGVITPMDNWVRETSTLTARFLGVEFKPNADEIEVGLFHSCGLFDSEVGAGEITAMRNLGWVTDPHSTPEVIILSTNATSISVGHRHTCAIFDDASLKCWGANEFGQVGDGGSANSNTPQDIDLGHGSKEQVPCERGTYQPLPEKTT